MKKNILVFHILAIFITLTSCSYTYNSDSNQEKNEKSYNSDSNQEKNEKPDICDCVQERKSEEGKQNYKLARKCMQTYSGEELEKADCGF